MKTCLIALFLTFAVSALHGQSSITRNCRTDGVTANGVTDDNSPSNPTSPLALQHCIDNAIAAGQSHIELPCGHILFSTPINLTNRPGLRFSGCGSDEGKFDVSNTTVLYCSTGQVCIDMAGSGLTRLEDFAITTQGVSNPGTVGIIMGRDNASPPPSGLNPFCFSENNEIERVSVLMPNNTNVNGGRGTLGLYNAGGAERLTIINALFQANTGMFFSTLNAFNITSPFETLVTGCDTAGSQSMSHVNLINVGVDLYGNGNGIYAQTTRTFDLQNVDFVNGGPFNCPINFAQNPSGNWKIRAIYEYDLQQPGNAAISGEICVGTNLDHIDANVEVQNVPAGTTFGVLYIYASNPSITSSRLSLTSSPAQQFVNNVPVRFLGGELNIEGTLAGSFNNVTLSGTLIHADTNLTFASGSHYLMMNPGGISIF